jgi:uncharacterized protein YdiU (UPF0061 family)
MNPAAEMQNLAMLFSAHKFQSFDPFLMNGRAMNQSSVIITAANTSRQHSSYL